MDPSHPNFDPREANNGLSDEAMFDEPYLIPLEQGSGGGGTGAASLRFKTGQFLESYAETKAAEIRFKSQQLELEKIKESNRAGEEARKLKLQESKEKRERKQSLMLTKVLMASMKKAGMGLGSLSSDEDEDDA